MNIYVQIHDDDGGFTNYKINQPVYVYPDVSKLQTIVDQLVSVSPTSGFNQNLNNGLSQLSIQDIQSLSSMLNGQSLSDKYALSQNSSTLFC